jgi:hypothetical protein
MYIPVAATLSLAGPYDLPVVDPPLRLHLSCAVRLWPLILAFETIFWDVTSGSHFNYPQRH